MIFDRAVGGSVQNLSTHFQKATITDPVSIPQNQHRFRRVLNRKLVAFNHFRDVYPGETSTQLHFYKSCFLHSLH